jgi:hypothetical protein
MQARNDGTQLLMDYYSTIFVDHLWFKTYIYIYILSVKITLSIQSGRLF